MVRWIIAWYSAFAVTSQSNWDAEKNGDFSSQTNQMLKMMYNLWGTSALININRSLLSIVEFDLMTLFWKYNRKKTFRFGRWAIRNSTYESTSKHWRDDRISNWWHQGTTYEKSAAHCASGGKSAHSHCIHDGWEYVLKARQNGNCATVHWHSSFFSPASILVSHGWAGVDTIVKASLCEQKVTKKEKRTVQNQLEDRRRRAEYDHDFDIGSNSR